MAEKHSFKKLKTLTPELVEEVDRRLLAGDSPAIVAKWLHEDCNKFLELKIGSLKKNLERYRATDLRNKLITNIVDKTMGVHGGKLAVKFNALEEMINLIGIQKGRLEKLIIKEQELPIGVVLNTATNEARLLKEMLVECGKLQLETGMLHRAPKKVTGTVLDPDSGEVRQFSWTEEQAALAKTLDDITYRDVDVDEDVQDAENV